MVITKLFGVAVRKVGTRYFAIPRPQTLFDINCARSHSMLDGNQWQAIMRQPLGGHVICNQKRADARRAARWDRTVIKARFT